MDFISVVSSIVGITQSLFDIKDKLINKKDQVKLSEWLISTGDLLAGVVGDIRNNVYPYAKCSQLNHNLIYLYQYTSDLFEKDTLEKISIMLSEAYKVEQMYNELNTIDCVDKERNLAKIEESVGIFYSLGNFVKLG